MPLWFCDAFFVWRLACGAGVSVVMVDARSIAAHISHTNPPQNTRALHDGSHKYARKAHISSAAAAVNATVDAGTHR